MATYLHFAPAVALAVAIGPRHIGWRLALAGAVCGVIPDADFLMVALHFDSYGGTYGHRGFTHSIGFALLVGALGALLGGRYPPRSRWLTATFLALCTASHPLLDGLIDRGICNAWLWPLDSARHGLPWRPIAMQGVPRFGLHRLLQEVLWIGVPLLLLTNAGVLLRSLARWWWGWRAASAALAFPAADASGLEPRTRADRPGAPVSRRQQQRLRRNAMQAFAARLVGERVRWCSPR